jgi:hypothetical protein
LSSPLSTSIKRLGHILKDGAEGQVAESENRLEVASESYWPLVNKLLVSDFKLENAHATAQKLFHRNQLRFAAIDGSEDQRLLGGLAVFWAGSSTATGTITYQTDKQPQVEYETGFIEKGQGIASCVPIYVDTIPEIDPQARPGQTGDQMTISQPKTEQSTVDNSTIPSWIMLFSELYLSYELARSNDYQIVLLDRSLSGTLGNLIHDTSRRALWSRQCALCGFEIDNAAINEQELAYSRYHTLGLEGTLPARGDYLRYATICLLDKAEKPLAASEIADRLGLTSDDRLGRLARYLKKSVDEGYLEAHGEMGDKRYSLDARYADSRDRVRKLVDLFGFRFFKSGVGNPLRITDGKESRWLTTLDLAFLCLFTLNLLIEQCLKQGILLLGITKDTTARDFITHLIPVCLRNGIWNETCEHVATTDRMLLQAISLFHNEKLAVPWSTIEYDSAFQTMIPDFKNREGYVSGAVRNRVTIEQLFVKSYIQLDEAKSDKRFRSNVLFIDRLCNRTLESPPTANFKHEYGGATEEVQPVLWQSRTQENAMQQLVMVTLKAMTQQSLPEVFGHNRPLFIADKIVKAQRDRASQIVSATGHWLVSHPKLRKFSFYMNTFRERRSDVEGARRRS